KETVYPFQLGDRTINVIVTEFDGTGNWVMINLHDNEQTSVAAGKKVLDEKGGMLISIRNEKERNISFSLEGRNFKFDPNRMFTKKGAEESLNRFGEATHEAIEIVSRF